MLRNGLATGIIFLFMGISVIPGINGNVRTIIDISRDVDIISETYYNGPQEEWNITYGGARWDQGVGLELTSNGDYVIGGTKDAIEYDNGGDCWIIKTDGSGTIEWEHTYGGPNTDWCHDICLTSDGGYAIVGATKSYGARNTDLFLVKTDFNGNEEWSKTVGGNGIDRGIAIQEISDGGFIISGMTSSFGSDEAWLIKTDENGNQIWNKTFGGNDNDGEYLVTVLETPEGGFIAAGRNYLGDTSDTLVVKTDRDGNIEWEKHIGDSNNHDAATFINHASDGGYIITGQVLHPSSEHDIYLIKVDSNGNEEWSNYYGTSFFDTGMSIEELDDGGFLITGEVSINYGPPLIHDAILIKTDSAGNELWSIVFGGAESDQGFEGHQTDDGGYIVVGVTESFGAGDKDAWLVKFSAFENQRPNKPSRPSGPTSGKSGTEYVFTSSATDPDGDQLYYLFDWGDGFTSFWLGPYESGEECSTSHIWFEIGNYEVKVKAQDSKGAESDWSDPLPISIPKTYEKYFVGLLERLFDWLEQMFGREILLGIFNF